MAGAAARTLTERDLNRALLFERLEASTRRELNQEAERLATFHA